ncbi:MAG: branched-subunit amino acid aminotransferase/4-amino-4-deoxychorismate lyase [Kiritimatiellia bacterium]|jgi:4-amino-4-deoxychorismate lyase
MDRTKHLTLDDILAQLQQTPADWQEKYLAFYSSFFGGIVTDPRAMLVPVDDHLVHRGDGVFETLKCRHGHVYNLVQHLDRLIKSCARIGLELPCDRTALEQIICDTLRAGGNPDCLARILVARGPGGLSVNPYESIGTQVYIVVYDAKLSFMEHRPEGASIAFSDIPGKPSYFATIKTCNYLPNALMKKQAVDQGVDFVIGVDEHGYVTEGPTENIAIVTREGVLARPEETYLLTGTTLMRGMHLAEQLVAQGVIKGLEVRPITRDEVRQASEVLIFGTTTDVTAVSTVEGQAVGEGKPGPVWKALHTGLVDELKDDSDLRTRVF